MCDVTTSHEMLSSIKNSFQRRTLLNRLNVHYRFYLLKMLDNERVIIYVNRTNQLESDIKATEVSVSEQDLAMTVQCSLPSSYEHLIVSIDVLREDDSPVLTLSKAFFSRKSSV